MGQRGYDVMLAETSRTFGGRVTREAALPGLAEWGRVRDWRLGQIEGMDNVTLYPESTIAAADIPAMNAAHIIVATGAHWAADTAGRHNPAGLTHEMITSADHLLTAER